MKKIIYLMTITLSSVLLASCGSSTTESKETADTAKKEVVVDTAKAVVPDTTVTSINYPEQK